MAANAPMMIQEAMVHGNPEEGILPSGQVAGLIDDLPSVETLISGIIAEADSTLEALNKHRNDDRNPD
jgi:nitronate monooxygenase